MRELEFRYIWKHEKSLCTGVYNLKDIANGVAIPPKSRVGNIMKFWELIATDQFTGMLDKNGVKIFEGDIVFRSYNNLGKMIVAYKNGNHNLPVNGIVAEKFEIIGNIHEAINE